MEGIYVLVYDEVILKQLKKVDQQVKNILSKMFDKLELAGPNAGELLDSRWFIYEIKSKHPPIRLYFRHNIVTDEICIFEFEMKTSSEKQQNTIEKIKFKVSKT